MKSVNLVLGFPRASSAAGYQISVTSVRASFVTASVRESSTKTVVVTPTGNGPRDCGFGISFVVPDAGKRPVSISRETKNNGDRTYKLSSSHSGCYPIYCPTRGHHRKLGP